ncbi:Methyl-accepting chemotaxis protein [Rhodospirillaceae bacterium LM-1]|nr:Methyl-accepting chemotaxis protein [Rhodospirillaceae bacterium LM-1]
MVANEVKSLANQTAKATDEISGQINAIQSATREAVQGIDGITGTIRNINAIASSIATSVEEQSAATQEIARAAAQAAEGTRESSENIAEVSQSSSESASVSDAVRASAAQVNERIGAMHGKLQEIMRSGTGKAGERHTVNMAVTVAYAGRTQSCLLHDIALSGATVLDRPLDGADRDTEVSISSPQLGELKGSVMAKTATSTHVSLDLDEAEEDRLEKFLASRQRAA